MPDLIVSSDIDTLLSSASTTVAQSKVWWKPIDI